MGKITSLKLLQRGLVLERTSFSKVTELGYLVVVKISNKKENVETYFHNME